MGAVSHADREPVSLRIGHASRHRLERAIRRVGGKGGRAGFEALKNPGRGWLNKDGLKAVPYDLRASRPSLDHGITFANGSAMTHVTAISPGDAYSTPLERGRQNYRPVRILRWTFHHADDNTAVVCELALTGQDREYELRVPAEWSPTRRSVERFDDALTAFQRHAMIERRLLDEGWVLNAFESERITLH
jgi:hypothetical protein